MKSTVELLSRLWRILSFQRNAEVVAVAVGGVGNIPIPVLKIENTTSTPKIENIPVPKKRKKKHNHRTHQSKNKCLRKMAGESRRRNWPKK